MWLVDADAIPQLVKQRLKTFKGELFMNTKLGVPYYQTIFKKGVSNFLIYNELKKVVEEVYGVIKVEDMTLKIDNKKRELIVKMNIKGTYNNFTLEEAL